MTEQQPGVTRRDFLRSCLAATTTWVLAACAGQPAASAPPTPAAAPAVAPTEPATAAAPTEPATAVAPTVVPAEPPASAAPASAPTSAPQAQALPATPPCDDGDEPTIAQTEGPYYTPNTPERTSLLEPGMAGTKLVLTGYVLTTGCQPVARALVDFWHADDAGVYDNAGYRLRGHQFTDDQGRYTLETILPGLYPGRTRHIHVKVQAPNQPVLTTQLYFPDEPANGDDGIFRPELIMELQDAADGKAGAFSFVLEAA
jgi:protocatechuate 3,4-dioxygenase beta subunit